MSLRITQLKLHQLDHFLVLKRALIDCLIDWYVYIIYTIIIMSDGIFNCTAGLYNIIYFSSVSTLLISYVKILPWASGRRKESISPWIFWNIVLNVLIILVFNNKIYGWDYQKDFRKLKTYQNIYNFSSSSFAFSIFVSQPRAMNFRFSH